MLINLKEKGGNYSVVNERAADRSYEEHVELLSLGKHG
jgi:hypothetical protein